MAAHLRTPFLLFPFCRFRLFVCCYLVSWSQWAGLGILLVVVDRSQTEPGRSIIRELQILTKTSLYRNMYTYLPLNSELQIKYPERILSFPGLLFVFIWPGYDQRNSLKLTANRGSFFTALLAFLEFSPSVICSE